MPEAPNPQRTLRRPWLLAVVAVVFLVGALTTTATAQDRGQPRTPSQRITDGEEALLGQIPHQAAIYEGAAFICGGSIVSRWMVVSAAHCFDGRTGQISIRAGVLARTSNGGQQRLVDRIFDPDGDQDIAVLRLAEPLDLNNLVAPVELATSANIAFDQPAVVSGWGATDGSAATLSTVLLQTTVTLLSDDACSSQVAGAFDPVVEVCTASAPGAPCTGDSGGPLTIGEGQKLRLVGVVNRGDACATSSLSVYSKVAYHAEWISNLADAAELQGDGAGATCNGRLVTVYLAQGDLPTSGHDVIAGTSGDDAIAGGDGNDVICGFGGNDRIWGQGGNDVIFGGVGDDTLRGGAGDDLIRGGDGRDDATGGPGDDTVHGDAGDDKRLSGNTGEDFVHGGPGNDRLVTGNGGEDEVVGGAGNDKLTGGPRRDLLSGHGDDDLLRGGKGADGLYGGPGNDTLEGGPQADILDGGSGNDRCHGGTTGNGAPEADTAVACDEQVAIP